MNQFHRIGTYCNKCGNVICICEKEKKPLSIYESDTLNEFFERPKKPFYVHNVRKVLNQLNKEEISFSKMVEILNEMASDFYKNNN